MKMMIIALTLTAACMAARVFAELPNVATVGDKSIGQDSGASARLQLQGGVVDDGY